ncbi:hypothetical protein CRG98_006786 [Punica granatum]|uniref:Uncharacterized protein n=1 Tax=Punica granatum TaxID=22663 RepID=A0A2I0KY96_PUNGR|nr:hypothetical protein CRG98_006786 [Punica granatum]
MSDDDRARTLSGSCSSALQLASFIIRVDEKIESLLNDVKAEGNDEMIHDVESVKSNRESMKRKMHHLIKTLDETFNGHECPEEGLPILEAIIHWIFKKEEGINAKLDKHRELLEGLQYKKSRTSSELPSDLDQSGDVPELLNLSAQPQQGTASHQIDTSVRTNLGISTSTGLVNEEESKEDQRSPYKSFGDFSNPNKFPDVSSTKEDEKDDAEAPKLAIEIEEIEQSTKDLMAQFDNCEERLLLLLLWIIVLLSIHKMVMSKFQEFKSSLESLARKNSKAKLFKRLHYLAIQADDKFKKMEANVSQKLQKDQRGSIMELQRVPYDLRKQTDGLAGEVLDCFIELVVRLDSFMNYVGNLESQSLVKGAFSALKQIMKDIKFELMATRKKIKQLATLLSSTQLYKYSEYGSIVRDLIDACGISSHEVLGKQQDELGFT